MLRGGKMSAVIKANKVKLNDYGYKIDKTIPEIEKRENEPKNEQKKTDNIDWKAIVVETVDELREEYEREIENLKKEVIDAHKLVTEWQEKYKKLREQFSDALMVKDHAIKENAELENECLKLERENKSLSSELDHLKKEIVILRELSYLKLSKEVESA
jgi:predicted RNase H-like nuclease (RuvC/YqgF family)